LLNDAATLTERGRFGNGADRLQRNPFAGRLQNTSRRSVRLINSKLTGEKARTF
jgi:hypothetical protein